MRMRKITVAAAAQPVVIQTLASRGVSAVRSMLAQDVYRRMNARITL